MNSVCAFDVPTPGVKTVMLTVPARAISAAVMVAVSEVTDTKVVERSLPLTRTRDVVSKFVPVIVSVKAEPPTVTGAGLILEMLGVGAPRTSRTRTQSPSPSLLLPGVGKLWEPELAKGEPEMLEKVPFAGSYQRAVTAPVMAPRLTAIVRCVGT